MWKPEQSSIPPVSGSPQKPFPTGPGIRLYTNATINKDWADDIAHRTMYSWLPATPGSTTLRTDDMPWITDHVIADDKQTLSRSVIHMEKS